MKKEKKNAVFGTNIVPFVTKVLLVINVRPKGGHIAASDQQL